LVDIEAVTDLNGNRSKYIDLVVVKAASVGIRVINSDRSRQVDLVADGAAII